MPNTTVYQIRNTADIGTIASHFAGQQLFVRDAAESIDETDMLLHARIRSGDYFLTLAAELEKQAQLAASPELERLVSELIRVNKKYTIVKK
jgi:hypothetical protein